MSTSKPSFVYVTYIATSAERVWQALVDGKITRKYWRGVGADSPSWENSSDWKPGSPWRQSLAGDAQAVGVVGKVVESVPPRRLVLTWARPTDGEDPGKTSQVAFEVEPQREGLVKLTVLHEDLDPEMQRSVTGGWPQVLSNLKTLLETGRALSGPPQS